jgi:hypothetical protein
MAVLDGARKSHTTRLRRFRQSVVVSQRPSRQQLTGHSSTRPASLGTERGGFGSRVQRCGHLPTPQMLMAEFEGHCGRFAQLTPPPQPAAVAPHQAFGGGKAPSSNKAVDPRHSARRLADRRSESVNASHLPAIWRRYLVLHE